MTMIHRIMRRSTAMKRSKVDQLRRYPGFGFNFFTRVPEEFGTRIPSPTDPSMSVCRECAKGNRCRPIIGRDVENCRAGS